MDHLLSSLLSNLHTAQLKCKRLSEYLLQHHNPNKGLSCLSSNAWAFQQNLLLQGFFLQVAKQDCYSWKLLLLLVIQASLNLSMHACLPTKMGIPSAEKVCKFHHFNQAHLKFLTLKHLMFSIDFRAYPTELVYQVTSNLCSKYFKKYEPCRCNSFWPKFAF